MTITDTVKALAQARDNAGQFAIKRKALLEEFTSSLEYTEAMDIEREAAALVERLENTLRAEALGQYANDNNKSGTGYKIKSDTAVDIPDTHAAINWAKSNFTPALKLDEKVLKAAAKNGQVPAEIATVTEQPKVYIDSDLSKYLDA